MSHPKRVGWFLRPSGAQRLVRPVPTACAVGYGLAPLRGWGVLPLAIIAVLIATNARGQSPSVTRAVPSAVAPGKTVDVTLSGSALDLPTALWTSIPATAAFTAGSGDHATCRITLPPEAQVGVAALRIGTRGGVSNPHLFMVDDLPSVAGAGGNR